MNGAKVVKRTAFVLLGAGSLLLAFVAYQLWGTALYEHSAQTRLQQQLHKTLHTFGTLPAAQPGATGGGVSVSSKTAPATGDPSPGSGVGLISIPAIGLSQTAIVEGTGEGQLQQGPGHYPGTPLPGQAGNAAIAGHRTTYGAPFYNLDSLKSGDLINVETSQGLFQYQVVHTQIVQPENAAVLDSSVLPELTLTTCNPRYSASTRLIVQALLRTSIINDSFQQTGGSSGSTTTTRPPAHLADGGQQVNAGSNVRGGVVGGILWGLAAVVAAVAGRLAFSRLRGNLRLLSVPAVLGALALLLPCFQHISLALPASF